MNEPLVRVENLGKSFGEHGQFSLGRKQATVRAVDGVSFEIRSGETVTVLGKSGCGKSTLGRLLLRLIHPSDGKVFFEGADITSLSSRELRGMRRKAQIVFQDPYGSLSPRRSVADIVAEPLKGWSFASCATERNGGIAWLTSCIRSGCHRAIWTATRASFLGGSGSALASRGRFRLTRALSLPTSRSPRSTSLNSGPNREPAAGPPGAERILLSLHCP